MKPDDQLNLLQQIKGVDAPPFLLTRIRERIRSLDDEPVSTQVKWAFALTGLIVVLLNMATLLKTTGDPGSKQLDNLVSNMHLSAQNSFYDE